MVKNYFEKLMDYPNINMDDLLKSVLDQATKYALVGEAMSKAVLQASEYKTNKLLLEAKLDNEIRTAFNASLTEGAHDAKTKTKLTENQIDAKVKDHPDYKNMCSEYNLAESYVVLGNNLLTAMAQRATTVELLCTYWMDNDE